MMGRAGVPQGEGMTKVLLPRSCCQGLVLVPHLEEQPDSLRSPCCDWQ
jgi:hypothetical protein